MGGPGPDRPGGVEVYDLARGFAGTKRYQTVRLLGRGGMGAVYEVEDRSSGGRVALKVMLGGDASRFLRFKQEFRVMAELHHPNLVRLFELAQENGEWFFTMELVHGESLEHLLVVEDTVDHGTIDDRPGAVAREAPGETRRATPACDPEVLIGVVGQILDALEFLHGRGIVHRDLKPSNVIIDVHGVVRLLDFGLASEVDQALSISQDGALVGTLAYLSPEQFLGGDASPASDLYALGVTMFQMLSGELPFRGTPMQALFSRSERPPPSLDERVLGVPAPLVRIVSRLMSKLPEDRPGIAELRDALGLVAARDSSPGIARKLDTSSGELFVGRDRELAILQSCLERAAAGMTQLVLVSGPSGIGKSALAGILMRRASSRGFLCFRGRCFEREELPFVAFDRVIDAMALELRRWTPAERKPLVPALSTLERMFPGVGILVEHGAFPSLPIAEGSDPRALRQRALNAFVELVDRYQARAPLCLVLDDVQWADSDSFDLLDALLDRERARLLVLVLIRSQGAGRELALERLGPRLGGATSLSLDPLPLAEARKLVEAVTRGQLEPEISEALATQVDRNPFLVRRLAEHIARVAPSEQNARLDEVSSADDLIRQMIATLSPRAEQVLALAAASGGEVSAGLLRAASGQDAADFDLAVGELTADRFLKVLPKKAAEADARLDLYHDRIREAAYQSFSEDRRRQLHRTLAEALESLPDGHERDAEELVRHFMRSGERDRMRRWAVQAGEQAAAKFAFARAATLFLLVLEDPQPGEGPLFRARQWERAAWLFDYAGRPADAVRAYREALALWEAAPESEERKAAQLRLLGLTGAHLMGTREVQDGRACFERGLTLLGRPIERSVPGQLAVLAGLKTKQVLASRFGGDRAPAQADPVVVAELGFFDNLVRAYQPMWPLVAAEAALRAELIARRIDDKTTVQRALAFGATVPFFLGHCSPDQLEEAHKKLDAADAMARAHHLALGTELVQLNRALVWLGTDMQRALRCANEALEGFQRLGLIESFDGAFARAFHMFVLAFIGDDHELLARIGAELQRPHVNLINRGLSLSHRTCVLAHLGRLEEARGDLAQLRLLLADLPSSRLDILIARAECCVQLTEGSFAEAVAGGEVQEEKASALGTAAIGIDRTMWLEVYCDAMLGLLRTTGLEPRRKKWLRKNAAWMQKRGVFDFRCLGDRALAYLAQAEGRERDAAEAIRRALRASATNTAPHNRWLCLEAARDLGALTGELEREAAELTEKRGFVLPKGWRRS